MSSVLQALSSHDYNINRRPMFPLHVAVCKLKVRKREGGERERVPESKVLSAAQHDLRTRERVRERERVTERERESQRERESDRERESQTERESDRQRESQTERKTHAHTQR